MKLESIITSISLISNLLLNDFYNIYYIYLFQRVIIHHPEIKQVLFHNILMHPSAFLIFLKE